MDSHRSHTIRYLLYRRRRLMVTLYLTDADAITTVCPYLRLSGDAVSADDLPDGVDLLELVGELLHHVGDGADVHVEQLVQVLVVATDLQVVVPPHHPLRRYELQF